MLDSDSDIESTRIFELTVAYTVLVDGFQKKKMKFLVVAALYCQSWRVEADRKTEGDSTASDQSHK